MMYYSVMTQAYSEKEIPSSPTRSRTFDLPVTSSDALPLSYRKLVEAMAIKLGMPLSLLNNTSFSLFVLFIDRLTNLFDHGTLVIQHISQHCLKSLTDI